MMIKIITGWSHEGGSTVAHINLCELFNEYDLECYLYGPHPWHRSQTVYGKNITELALNDDDILITHLLNPVNIPKKCFHILSLHEKNIYDLRKCTEYIPFYDYIHFVSEEQRQWHQYEKPNYFVCNNVISDIPIRCNKNIDRVAGVIGSIDQNKLTHKSILRAISEGMDKILVFGLIRDMQYFIEYVKPLIDNNVVFYEGYRDHYCIYSSISHVYHSARSETFCMLQYECEQGGIEFHGTGSEPELIKMDKPSILSKWSSIIEKAKNR